ncbi:dienelactone hydrolase family protein [Glaciihabitans sp. UYNi722]|uniref:dienelactone hydrolase family protein n=1 Tax=Glaciihabitans sp. UYNi722 TaxID=3156344 RepID=UPI0033945D13
MPETISLPVTEAGNGRPTDFSAYLARPKGEPVGALIVIHEIWGLVEHITSVAARFAAEGYLVLAPDLLSSVGIEAQVGMELNAIMTSPDEKLRIEGQTRLRDAFAPMRVPEFGTWAISALRSSVDYLEAQPGINGRIAVTGFCFGGTYSFALAAADTRVRVAVPFYGAPPELADVAKITAPILALYGQDDPRLMESLPEVTAAMRAAGVDFSSKVYEGAGHAFFNDTSPHAYKPDVAADAWRRTLQFLAAHIG